MAVPLVGGLVTSAALGAFFRGATQWAMRWLGPVVAQVLVFFGLSLVAREYGVGPLISEMQAAFSGAPAMFVQVLGYVGADVVMSMVLSAYVTRAAGSLFLRRA